MSQSDYPCLLNVSWEYENENGMPSSETHQLMGDFEDALDKIDRPGIGTLMLAITGNGRREWIWYVRNPQEWQNHLDSCLDGLPEYLIKIEYSEEKDWSTWRLINDSSQTVDTDEVDSESLTVEAFEHIRASTDWNLDGEMLWGFFFTDSTKENLEAFSKRFTGDGYRVVDIY